jgi:hypothetical protein
VSTVLVVAVERALPHGDAVGRAAGPPVPHSVGPRRWHPTHLKGYAGARLPE